MKKNFPRDYFLYLIAKTISSIIRFIPLFLSVYLARAIGILAFYGFRNKRNTAYKNIKIAFPQYSFDRINKIVKKTFMNSAQHIMEIFYFPWLDEKYIKKFIEFEGLEEVSDIIKDKKGVIFLGLHEGSWEVASVVLGRTFKQYNYTILARTQPGIALLDKLLNEYRSKNYCGVIEIKDNLRELINHLKRGFALGMVADHGGQEGIFVNFFGRLALTPVGAVRLALKFDTHLILGFMKRNGIARHKIKLSVYTLIRTQDIEQDVKLNLENINRRYEEYITVNPQEYLWFFKRWKYSPQRNVLILSDGKAGHLKQSQAVSDLMKNLPFQIESNIVEVKFKNRWQKVILVIYGLFFGNGYRWYLRRLIEPNDFQKLFLSYYDAVISCGSSLSMANSLIAASNMAKSIVIMKPGIFSLKRFDLVILPEHDKTAIHTAIFNNVAYIKGAISSPIDRDSPQLKNIIQNYGLDRNSIPHPVIGFILGGDNKYLSLDSQSIKKILISLKQSAEDLGATLLASTSRRTPLHIERLLKEDLKDYPKCKMLIIANEYNPLGSFETILNCSDILIISGDSISMVSEGINSGKYTLVFRLKRKKPFFLSKHERFIENLEKDKYIQIISEMDLVDKIAEIWKIRPAIKKLDDRNVILNRLKNIL